MIKPSNIKVVDQNKAAASSAAKNSRFLPLRTVLIVPFVLQIFAAVGLVGYLSFKNGQKAVNEIADRYLTEVGSRVEQNLRSYLSVPHQVNQSNAAAINLGTLKLEDLPALQRHFWQQVQIFDSLTFSGLGLENKENIGAERLDDGSLTLRISTAESRYDFRTYSTNKSGDIVALLNHKQNFDPRTRPWYKAAVAAGKPTWSQIYPNTAGITAYLGASMPFYDRQGKLQGVLLTNINLSTIGKFLQSLKIGKTGQVFILERSGMLVATSTGERPYHVLQKEYGAERVKVVDSSNNLTKTTAEYLAAKFNNFQSLKSSQSLEFDVRGQKQFLQVLPWRDDKGLDWLIVVVVPEADFMAQINANTQTTILLCIAALTVATIVGVLAARWVTKPILSLNNAAKNIAKGEWSKTLDFYREDEVGQLAKSFNDMAKQLEASFGILEQKVQERTADLEVAKQKAEVANEAKSSFLANMSHELRSPLNAILGFSQLMIRSKNLSPEHQENVSIITRSGEHLLALINQVLDLSKIEAGRTTLNEKNFDFYRLLNDVQDMLDLKASEKGLQLIFDRSPDVPRYICTDEVKLRQVLINLLNNAIKFTSTGGVSVRVGMKPHINTTETGFLGNTSLQPLNQAKNPVSERDRLSLCFEVEDTGAGIAADELDSLFEAFVQTKTGKESQEGTGLGLPISRKFVQLMGGEMTVISTVGYGTIFTFEIQARVVSEKDIESQQPTRRVIALEPNQPRYRILIVDDTPLNRQLLIKLLNPLGFELKEASNGKEAIAVWDEWEPHLIWMDMRMPVMDGYEATKQIKATTKGQATAVIALTASVLEEERAIVLSAGCDDFVRKPFRESEIFAVMDKNIGVRYVYEDAIENDSPIAQNGEQGALTAAAIAQLPREWVADLQRAIPEGDLDSIASAIDQIRTLNASLANAIEICTDNFEYDEILTLINESKEQDNQP